MPIFPKSWLRKAPAQQDLAPAVPQDILTQTREILEGRQYPLAAMSDAELEKFNGLLPWAAMTCDGAGRVVGRAHSATKRAKVHSLIDRRHSQFGAALPWRNRRVLEVGCFEGIHTLGLLREGAQVTAVDGRIENVLKTQARLWAYGFACPLVHWDVETPPVAALRESWDILHHIGVLYHLATPVEHLEMLLPRTRMAVLLDTHVADGGATPDSITVNGRTYACRGKPEAGAAVSPFAGMKDHAKYLLLADILSLLASKGFRDCRVVSARDERNGRRITLWAFRDGVAPPA